jgi:hypothetical protein
MNLSDEIAARVAMKKNRSFISVILLVALASINCAQTSDQKAATRSASTGPELRWKYESGG